MKKNPLSFDDTWTFEAADPGDGAAAPAGEPAADRIMVDDGDSFPLAAETVSAVTVSAPKPVASIATLADYLVNGFWQYAGTTAHHFASNTISYNITGLNSSEQFLAQTALQAWSEVANITFVQTSGAADITFSHNGTMQAYTSGSWWGGAVSYQTVNISTDWVTTDGGANDGKTGIDSYAYQTYLHEIGHALGLGHQGPYNGSASYATNAIYANDTWQYSLMSYFSEPNYSGSSYRYVITPQMADIYAMVAMYGAQTQTRTGDTVYGFNSNAGAVFSFGNYSPAPALTIYDSNGNDTLDCSGYSVAQTIDLHSGAFSSVGGLVNNIGIALNAIIEKAIGGAGNDTLIASNTSCSLSGGGGNDTLIGGTGNENLVGGSGTDLAVFSGVLSNYVIAYNSGTQTFTVVDQRSSGTTDGSDTVTGVENFQFSDGTYSSSLFTGPPVVIEAVGSTSLVQVGSYYFLNSISSGTGPQLKYAGATVLAGQFGAWTPIGTEQTSGGYQVVMKNGGADSYVVWTTDASGNYVTNSSLATGSSSTIKSLEVSFQQDLNGDGVIGSAVVSGTTIEAFGATKLVQSGSNFYLQSISTGSGPDLRYNGASVVAGQFGAWTPIGTEQTSSGYQVVLKNGSADSYVVWITDNNGNYLTNLSPATGASSAMTSLEVSFQQDLNGDGTIGAAAPSGTTIEALGSTKLVLLSNNYYLQNISSGSGPTLKYSSAAVVAGQFGAWTPIGTEQTSSGYQVVLKNGSADSYVVWMTDTSGNYVTNLAPATGSSSTITSLETSFQQDLNGDGTIGAAAPSGTTIEALGSTKLVLLSNNYYLQNIGSGSGPTLKYSGAAVTAGQFGAWTPIGTEQTSSGYQIVMKNGSADSYVVWTTDTNGNYLTNSAPASGNSSTITSLESSFQQDLNGDGIVSAAVAPSANSPIGTSQLSLAASDSHAAFQFKPDLGLQAGEVFSGHLEASAPVDAHVAMDALADWLASAHSANAQAFAAAISDHDGQAVPSLEQLALHAGFVIVH